jgi:hypothetical protein
LVVACGNAQQTWTPASQRVRYGQNCRIAITTTANNPAAVPSTSAAPNARFQAADRLLAHENTIDASSPKPSRSSPVKRPYETGTPVPYMQSGAGDDRTIAAPLYVAAPRIWEETRIDVLTLRRPPLNLIAALQLADKIVTFVSNLSR